MTLGGVVSFESILRVHWRRHTCSTRSATSGCKRSGEAGGGVGGGGGVEELLSFGQRRSICSCGFCGGIIEPR